MDTHEGQATDVAADTVGPPMSSQSHPESMKDHFNMSAIGFTLAIFFLRNQHYDPIIYDNGCVPYSYLQK